MEFDYARRAQPVDNPSSDAEHDSRFAAGYRQGHRDGFAAGHILGAAAAQPPTTVDTTRHLRQHLDDARREARYWRRRLTYAHGCLCTIDNLPDASGRGGASYVHDAEHTCPVHGTDARA